MLLIPVDVEKTLIDFKQINYYKLNVKMLKNIGEC